MELADPVRPVRAHSAQTTGTAALFQVTEHLQGVRDEIGVCQSFAFVGGDLIVELLLAGRAVDASPRDRLVGRVRARVPAPAANDVHVLMDRRAARVTTSLEPASWIGSCKAEASD